MDRNARPHLLAGDQFGRHPPRQWLPLDEYLNLDLCLHRDGPTSRPVCGVPVRDFGSPGRLEQCLQPIPDADLPEQRLSTAPGQLQHVQRGALGLHLHRHRPGALPCLCPLPDDPERHAAARYGQLHRGHPGPRHGPEAVRGPAQPDHRQPDHRHQRRHHRDSRKPRGLDDLGCLPRQRRHHQDRRRRPPVSGPLRPDVRLQCRVAVFLYPDAVRLRPVHPGDQHYLRTAPRRPAPEPHPRR